MWEWILHFIAAQELFVDQITHIALWLTRCRTLADSHTQAIPVPVCKFQRLVCELHSRRQMSSWLVELVKNGSIKSIKFPSQSSSTRHSCYICMLKFLLIGSFRILKTTSSTLWTALSQVQLCAPTWVTSLPLGACRWTFDFVSRKID